MFVAKSKIKLFNKEKLVLFLAVAAMSFSCSDDDSKGGGGSDKISFKVNGVSKTMTNVQVNEEVEDGETYLIITGSMGQSASEVITFSTVECDVGSGMAYSWGYIKDGETYWDNGDVTSIIETNSSKKLKGSFSGTLSSWTVEENIEVTITDGSFNINR